jgi:two-component system LytT family response regulator
MTLNNRTSLNHIIKIDKSNSFFWSKNTLVFVLTLCAIVAIAVLQDFLFSRLKNTGFYLSESLLYNTYWAYFLPFLAAAKNLFKKFAKGHIVQVIGVSLLVSLVLSAVHIIAFTGVFTGVSSLVFKPAHRFLTILNTVISNELIITFLVYGLVPPIYLKAKSIQEQKNNQNARLHDLIRLKVGTDFKTVKVAAINLIQADRPYTALYVEDQKLLVSSSLKHIEKQLDSKMFLRVHRSVIVNRQSITLLSSRKNGDYDATLTNGKIVRLSRHYRSNWSELLGEAKI